MNNWQELEQNLSLTFQADNNIRTEATKWLNQAVAANYNVFVNNMAALLLESNNLSVKSAASIFFKNNLVLEKWFQIQNRDQIKLTLLNALAKANCVAQPIAALAAIELPQNQWLDLIPSLLNLLNQGDEAKMAALKTIGYICESVSPQILSSHSNNILTAVAQGARKDESNDSVKLAAIEALSNSLSFCARNFDNADERNYIMQIVCESTLAVNVDVRVASFECLVRIVQMYYEKMQIYMQKALFNLSVGGMKDEQESVALQAVEFWSTICEIEMDIMYVLN